MKRPERVNLGYVGVVVIPKRGRSQTDITTHYAPGAQKAGNVVLMDVDSYSSDGTSYWRAVVVHANPQGTDRSDLARFAEAAARKLGMPLPSDYDPVLECRPIRKVSRPHTGTPRKAPWRRRRPSRVNARGLSAA